MALRTLSTAALRRELARREAGATRLTRKRAKLAKALAAMDAELAGLGVDAPKRRGRPPGRRGPGRRKGSKNRKPGPPPGRRHPNNTLNLPDALAAAVRPGALVSPAKAAGIVKARGYRTTDKAFGKTVSKTLATHQGFRRKGRGQYERVAG
jgi:hypothetical protein